MKCIVLFGAGKSSSGLINYLKIISFQYNWQVLVADANLELATHKTGAHSHVMPVQIDVYDDEQRSLLIKQADVVISLLPPTFHILIAKECVQYSKHLLTASYVDDPIKSLEKEIKDKGLLFLCEMGLDPGIDHMSAMQLIHRIQNNGGVITSFKSHCGGLVAPESDNNPWHYKISWNPRNVVMAGKAGAVYKENNNLITTSYEQLFVKNKVVAIPGFGDYAWYANRDSISYAGLYGLHSAHTFIRTTLRHPFFLFGWKNIIDLKFTDESIVYNTDGLSVARFFQEHYEKVNFERWMNEKLETKVNFAKSIQKRLANIEKAQQEIIDAGSETATDFMMVDDNGNLNNINIEAQKKTSAIVADFLIHKAAIALQQLFFLGLEDKTLINKGLCSVADILQFIIERKLAMQPGDKDLVLMMHEIEYLQNNAPHQVSSYLAITGDNHVSTAMAKTVGLPLGIAAKLLLEGTLTETGLHIPIIPSIYEPVLKELALHGIVFTEF